MGLLIDMDYTLLDTTITMQPRRAGHWRRVFAVVRELEPYDGISELLAELNNGGIPICIVSTATAPLIQAIVRHCGWTVNDIIGYRDTTRRKPHPDPYLEGLSRLGIRAEEAIAVGDSADDVLAARAAGIRVVGAMWGTRDRRSLLDARPDEVCETVNELTNLLRGHYGLIRQ